MNMQGRVGIVTGGGSGIGAATAKALAAAGASVVVTDINLASAQGIAHDIAASGGTAAALKTDVSSAFDVAAMVRFAEERFGGLDILVNNAGLMYGQPGFADQSTEVHTRMMQVNVGGVMLGTHAAIPALERRGGGAIVQVGSVAGLVRYSASPVYAASKAAIVAFTRSLGILASTMNIRVNCVSPGSVETEGVRRMRAMEVASGCEPAPMQKVRMPAEQVARAILRCVTDRTLAGDVLKVMPNEETEILRFPDWGIVRD